MTNKNVLAAAKAIAFAGRNRHDASKDAAEFWEHTGEDARAVAMRQARAAAQELKR
jgi:hypothetical protein